MTDRNIGKIFMIDMIDSPQVANAVVQELTPLALVFFQRLVQTLPLASLVIHHSDARICYANPAFNTLVGQAEEKVTGALLSEMLPEKATLLCEKLIKEVSENRKTGVVTETVSFASQPPDAFCRYTVWSMADDAGLVGITFQIMASLPAVHTYEQVVSINEALLRSLIQQNELLAQSEVIAALNIRLKRSVLETDHRVKNNLQVISALAQVQIKGNDKTVPVEAMRRIVTHVTTLAQLHDLLTQQARLDTDVKLLNTQDTLGKLIPLLQNTVGLRTLTSSISQVFLPIGKSGSLSLLVSELVSNAVKHGAGAITVTLTQDGEKVYLEVCDEGEGFPEGFDPMKRANTGMHLIVSMAQFDLQGELEFTNSPEGGGCVKVNFLPPA